MLRIIKHLPIIMMMIFLSYKDIKTRRVSDKAVILLMMYSILIVEDFKVSVLVGLSIFIMNMLVVLLFKGGIGGGDIKVMTVIAFTLGWDFYFACEVMLVLTLITALYGVVKGNGIKFEVPYIPYICVGYIYIYICFNSKVFMCVMV